MLAQIRLRSKEALSDLEDLAQGIYHPARRPGPGGGVQAPARKTALQASLKADGLGRYPEAETAVYFCVLQRRCEGVAKYAPASRRSSACPPQWCPRLLRQGTDPRVGSDPNAKGRGSGIQG